MRRGATPDTKEATLLTLSTLSSSRTLSFLILQLLSTLPAAQFINHDAFESRLRGACPPGSFDCGRGQCVHIRCFHDGKPDCWDGSDEFCFPGHIKCGVYCVDFLHLGQCLVNAQCNGRPNQPSFCKLSKEKICREEGALPCKGYGECVLPEWAGDDKRDCIDGSDQDATYMDALQRAWEPLLGAAPSSQQQEQLLPPGAISPAAVSSQGQVVHSEQATTTSPPPREAAFLPNVGGYLLPASGMNFSLDIRRLIFNGTSTSLSTLDASSTSSSLSPVHILTYRQPQPESSTTRQASNLATPIPAVGMIPFNGATDSRQSFFETAPYEVDNPSSLPPGGPRDPFMTITTLHQATSSTETTKTPGQEHPEFRVSQGLLPSSVIRPLWPPPMPVHPIITTDGHESIAQRPPGGYGDGDRWPMPSYPPRPGIPTPAPRLISPFPITWRPIGGRLFPTPPPSPFPDATPSPGTAPLPAPAPFPGQGAWPDREGGDARIRPIFLPPTRYPGPLLPHPPPRPFPAGPTRTWFVTPMPTLMTVMPDLSSIPSGGAPTAVSSSWPYQSTVYPGQQVPVTYPPPPSPVRPVTRPPGWPLWMPAPGQPQPGQFPAPVVIGQTRWPSGFTPSIIPGFQTRPPWPTIRPAVTEGAGEAEKPGQEVGASGLPPGATTAAEPGPESVEATVTSVSKTSEGAPTEASGETTDQTVIPVGTDVAEVAPEGRPTTESSSATESDSGAKSTAEPAAGTTDEDAADVAADSACTTELKSAALKDEPRPFCECEPGHIRRTHQGICETAEISTVAVHVGSICRGSRTVGIDSVAANQMRKAFDVPLCVIGPGAEKDEILMKVNCGHECTLEQLQQRLGRASPFTLSAPSGGLCSNDRIKLHNCDGEFECIEENDGLRFECRCPVGYNETTDENSRRRCVSGGLLGPGCIRIGFFCITTWLLLMLALFGLLPIFICCLAYWLRRWLGLNGSRVSPTDPAYTEKNIRVPPTVHVKPASGGREMPHIWGGMKKHATAIGMQGGISLAHPREGSSSLQLIDRQVIDASSDEDVSVVPKPPPATIQETKIDIDERNVITSPSPTPAPPKAATPTAEGSSPSATIAHKPPTPPARPVEDQSAETPILESRTAAGAVIASATGSLRGTPPPSITQPRRVASVPSTPPSGVIDTRSLPPIVIPIPMSISGHASSAPSMGIQAGTPTQVMVAPQLPQPPPPSEQTVVADVHRADEKPDTAQQAVLQRRESEQSVSGQPSLWESFRVLGEQYAKFNEAGERRDSSHSLDALIVRRFPTSEPVSRSTATDTGTPKLDEQTQTLTQLPVEAYLEPSSETPSPPQPTAEAAKAKTGTATAQQTKVAEMLGVERSVQQPSVLPSWRKEEIDEAAAAVVSNLVDSSSDQQAIEELSRRGMEIEIPHLDTSILDETRPSTAVATTASSRTWRQQFSPRRKAAPQTSKSRSPLPPRKDTLSRPGVKLKSPMEPSKETPKLGGVRVTTTAGASKKKTEAEKRLEAFRRKIQQRNEPLSGASSRKASPLARLPAIQAAQIESNKNDDDEYLNPEPSTSLAGDARLPPISHPFKSNSPRARQHDNGNSRTRSLPAITTREESSRESKGNSRRREHSEPFLPRLPSISRREAEQRSRSTPPTAHNGGGRRSVGGVALAESAFFRRVEAAKEKRRRRVETGAAAQVKRQLSAISEKSAETAEKIASTTTPRTSSRRPPEEIPSTSHLKSGKRSTMETLLSPETSFSEKKRLLQVSISSPGGSEADQLSPTARETLGDIKGVFLVQYRDDRASRHSQQHPLTTRSEQDVPASRRDHRRGRPPATTGRLSDRPAHDVAEDSSSPPSDDFPSLRGDPFTSSSMFELRRSPVRLSTIRRKIAQRQQQQPPPSARQVASAREEPRSKPSSRTARSLPPRASPEVAGPSILRGARSEDNVCEAYKLPHSSRSESSPFFPSISAAHHRLHGGSGSLLSLRSSHGAGSHSSLELTPHFFVDPKAANPKEFLWWCASGSKPS